MKTKTKKSKLKKTWIFTMSLLVTMTLCIFATIISFFIRDFASVYFKLVVVLHFIILATMTFNFIYMFLSKKILNKWLVYSCYMIAFSLLLYSFILARFPQHQQIVIFTLMSNTNGDYLIDGWYFLAGLIVFQMSKIFKYSLSIQEEVDDII